MPVTLMIVMALAAGEVLVTRKHVAFTDRPVLQVEQRRQTAPLAAPGFSALPDGCLRWSDADAGLRWIPDRIALGDFGATVLAGKELNNARITLHAAGAPQPVFDLPTTNSVGPISVAVAEEAPVAAALIVTDTDPGPGVTLQPTVHVFRDFETGPALWSYAFPPDSLLAGGGVAISRRGDVILTWWAHWDLGDVALVRAFDVTGHLLSSAELTPHAPISAKGQLSDDGSRALIDFTLSAVVYNVITGQQELEVDPITLVATSSMSRDGNRVAVGAQDGNRGSLRVWQRDATGAWTQLRKWRTPTDTYVTCTALDAHGARAAFIEQDRNAEGYRASVYLVDEDRIAFEHPVAAPGTDLQLFASGVELSDDGRILAVSSWGDDHNLTPEAFVLDDTGALLCEVDTRGSAECLDLTADGEVLAIGAKATHANVFGNGGDVVVIDSLRKTLAISGRPRIGEALAIELAGSSSPVLAYLPVTSALNGDPSARIRLDLGTGYAILGPFTVPPAGLTLPVTLPADPLAIGLPAHVQAFVVDAAGTLQDLSNKVSIRIVE